MYALSVEAKGYMTLLAVAVLWIVRRRQAVAVVA